MYVLVNILLLTGQYNVSDIGLFLGVFSGIVVILLIAIIAIFVAVIFTLYKANLKAKMETRLEEGKDSDSKIYEEIDPLPQRKTSMDTADNVAYTSCDSILRSTSCTYHV